MGNNNSEHSIESLLKQESSKTDEFEREILLLETIQQHDKTSLATNRSYLRTHPEKILSNTIAKHFLERLKQLQLGVPLAYVLGHQTFWKFNFKVNQDTLIPRPDTETLIESTLQHIPENKPLIIADLGTGSGAIALSIAHERPMATIIAVDISMSALKVAQKNAQDNHINNCHFLHSSWLTGFKYQIFDLIVSNPPYIAQTDPHLKALKHEPLNALISGEDGLNDIRQLTHLAAHYLKPQGHILLEHGYDQADKVKDLLYLNGFSKLRQYQDLAGIIRVSDAKRGQQNIINPNICPLCHKSNHCEAKKEKQCWCNQVKFSSSLLRYIEPILRNKACVCKKCIEP